MTISFVMTITNHDDSDDNDNDYFSVTLDATIERCDSLHERWQQHQQTYFSAPLADMEHR